MLEFEIKSKTLTLGERKGQIAYFAHPKSQQKISTETVVDRIVRETSLSEGAWTWPNWVRSASRSRPR